MARMSSFRLRHPLFKRCGAAPEMVATRIRCNYYRRAPVAATLIADNPEPEPERQPHGCPFSVLLLWVRLTRRARRLARLCRLWVSLGHHFREVKQRGKE